MMMGAEPGRVDPAIAAAYVGHAYFQTGHIVVGFIGKIDAVVVVPVGAVIDGAVLVIATGKIALGVGDRYAGAAVAALPSMTGGKEQAGKNQRE